MMKFLESIVVFTAILSAWVIFAVIVASLVTSLLPGDKMAEFAGGWISILSLLIALGVSSRIVGRRIARFPSNQSLE
jgi:hypothetical protein